MRVLEIGRRGQAAQTSEEMTTDEERREQASTLAVLALLFLLLAFRVRLWEENRDWKERRLEQRES